MRKPSSSAVRRWLYENSLLLTITVLTIGALAGQIATGHAVHNQERGDLGLATLELGQCWALLLYAHSLSIVLGVLFALSFALHVVGGAELESLDRVARGEDPISAWQYLGTATLWFESLQNWQSEFVSIMAIVGLSVFLRERGSPESKPVDAAHGETED